MKKIFLYLTLLVSYLGHSQFVADEGIQITGGQPTVTTVNFLTTTDLTTGLQGKVAPQNISIPQIPLNYSVLTPTIGGHLDGIDAKLGSIVATTAGQTTRVWFTADGTTVGGNPYYQTGTTKGTAPIASQSVSNDDNEKKYFTQDVIGAPFVSPAMFPPGVYAGNLSASTTPNSAQQRWTVELYKCDNSGTPIASGVTGAAVGSLGVTVITILDSGLLTLADGSVTNVQVSGNLGGTGFSINAGERVRYHVSAEKVGTAASNITQSVYYGTSYNSFIDVTVPLNTNSVVNLSDVPGAATTDALDNLYTTKADLDLAAIVANSTVGYFTKGGQPFIHNFYAAANPTGGTGNNLNVGVNSGNFNSNNRNYASTMVGFESGLSNRDGYSNSGLGYYTLRDNLDGFGNTAVGTFALGHSVSGNSNTSVGWHSSLFRISGNYNTVFGVETFQANTTGGQNTILGANAGYNNTTGNANVFLGYAAGLNELGSEKLYISNSSTANPLIKGDFSTGELEINSGLTNKLRIGGTGVTLSALAVGNTYQNLYTDSYDVYFNISGVNKMTLTHSGDLNLVNLAGTGTRQVVADASGNLSATTPQPLKYVALLTQTGTSAPTATVLENTLGGTVVWSYTSVGNYTGTLSGAFTVSKTGVTIGNGFYNGNHAIVRPNGINDVRVMTVNTAGAFVDGSALNDSMIEIRVYP